MTDSLRVAPGTLVYFERLGISLRAGFNEDDSERPYVSIDTSDLPPRFTYDERTGLRGDAKPYEAVEQGDESWTVNSPSGQVASIMRIADEPAFETRLRAHGYAQHLNNEWHKRCGMPIVAVHLNDGAEIYDDEGSGNTARLTPEEEAMLSALEEIREHARDANNTSGDVGEHVFAVLQRLEAEA